MMFKSMFKRILSTVITIAVVFSFIPLTGGLAYAASKNPAAPVITSAKETSKVEDDFKRVTVKWKKAKNAQKYQVAIRSEKKKWVKEKTVKKSKANKKKYTKKKKYRVVAKGGKYVVYSYKYSYSIKGETEKRSFNLIDGVTFGRWADTVLKPMTTYTIAVRSVNGNKYSAWKTVKMKTGHSHQETKKITKPGASLTMKFGGNSLRVTIGTQITLPVPKSSKGAIEAEGISLIPSKIERYAEYYNDGRFIEDITVEGKTADGLDAWWNIETESGVVRRVHFSRKHPTFNADGSKYSFTTNAGSGYGPNGFVGRTKAEVSDPNTTIAWTLDGAEPKPGQADKSIDSSEYPFGQIMVKFAPFSGSVQVRGTSVQGRLSNIWPELTTTFDRCEWIRVYNGDTIVEETFMCDGY
ncbi:MAG: hypothetical protein IKE52_05000 [Mogibacterium sp.]|nr:hypothetical protein [Mogibacterium sp.]